MTLNEILSSTANVSEMPRFNGDGYSYGGESIVTIGGRSFPVGIDKDLADEIAHRWNEHNAKRHGSPTMLESIEEGLKDIV